jgi:YesN/AraC family two-component response regulator
METMTSQNLLPVVLVVDDEPLVRSFARHSLQQIATVVEAENAEQAFEILGDRMTATHVALVDDGLPDRSGLDVLKATKHAWPWIRVVILTAFGSEDLAVQALRGGASDYLRKPMTFAALLETVGKLLYVGVGSEPAVATASPGSRQEPSRMHPNIRRAVAFVREHYAETIGLNDVAREARLSRFHFCRLFRAETGMSFHEYLNDLRVRQAKLLLANRFLRISEIAYTVGFNDLSHFDRTFRKKVGRSPTEYRALLKCA